MSPWDSSCRPPSGKKPPIAIRIQRLSDSGAELLQILEAEGILSRAKTSRIDLVESLDAEQFQPAMLRWLARDVRGSIDGIGWKDSFVSMLERPAGRKSMVDRYYRAKRETMRLDHHFELEADQRCRQVAMWIAECNSIPERDAFEKLIAERYDELIQFNGWDESVVPERYQRHLAVARARVEEKQG